MTFFTTEKESRRYIAILGDLRDYGKLKRPVEKFDIALLIAEDLIEWHGFGDHMGITDKGREWLEREET